jgi:hypothetical protein
MKIYFLFLFKIDYFEVSPVRGVAKEMFVGEDGAIEDPHIEQTRIMITED